MKNLLAQIDISPPGGFEGPGTRFVDPGTNSASKFEQLFSTIIGVMTIIAGIWFIFIILIGAIGWMTAGGDKGAVETARKRIANGVTGLLIVVIAVPLIGLVGRIIGLDILNIENWIVALSA